MARTTLESIQHAIEVNSSLALPIALENLSRLTHLALLTVPFNLIHILVFSLKDFRPDLGHQLWRQEIMYAHGAMALLFGGIGLLALWLRRQPPKLWRMRLLILLGGAGIIGFGVAIACIDQRITSNITPLLLACFACAMFILIRPAYAVPFYGLAMLAFEVAMDHAQADPQLRLSNQANGLTAFGLGLLLSQGGEFGFVLFAQAQNAYLIAPQAVSLFSAVVTLSMATTPFLMIFARRLEFSRGGKEDSRDGPEHAPQTPVIIIGYGRFGQTVSQMLMAADIDVTLIDKKPAQIDLSGRFDMKVYYGDGTRIDLLRRAGAEEARLIAYCIDDPHLDKKALEPVLEAFPQAAVMVRCFDRRQLMALNGLDLAGTVRHRVASGTASTQEGTAALKLFTDKNYSSLELLTDRGMHPRQDEAWRSLQRSRGSEAEWQQEAGGDWFAMQSDHVYPDAQKKQVGDFPWVPFAGPTFCAIDDGTHWAMWFIQYNESRGRFHIIDFYANSGKRTEFYGNLLRGRYKDGYDYGPNEHDIINLVHTMPINHFIGDTHGAHVEQIAGMSVIEHLAREFGIYVNIDYMGMKYEDRMKALDDVLPYLDFNDTPRVKQGLYALANYRFRPTPEGKEVAREQRLPLHNDHSHAATALEFWANLVNQYLGVYAGGKIVYEGASA